MGIATTNCRVGSRGFHRVGVATTNCGIVAVNKVAFTTANCGRYCSGEDVILLSAPNSAVGRKDSVRRTTTHGSRRARQDEIRLSTTNSRTVCENTV